VEIINQGQFERSKMEHCKRSHLLSWLCEHLFDPLALPWELGKGSSAHTMGNTVAQVLPPLLNVVMRKVGQTL